MSDLALVELTTPVRTSITPIAFAQLGHGSRLRLVGWGLTQFPPPQPAVVPTTLQQRDTTRLSEANCAGGFPGLGDLCVGDGSCSGDSGAPALRRSPVGWVSIGIASRETSASCAGPTVYTDPTYGPFRAWMLRTVLTSKLQPCTCPPSPYAADTTIRADRFKPLIVT